MCEGERPIGAKGKQTNTVASCQLPPGRGVLNDSGAGGVTGRTTVRLMGAAKRPGKFFCDPEKSHPILTNFCLQHS